VTARYNGTTVIVASATVVVAVPVPPPPTTVDYYMATNGSDTTGDGTIGKPWATMQKFVESAPAAGATLYVRGGNYPYVNDRNPCLRNARDTWPSLIGTASKPITIRNYQSETVNITGATGPIISLGPNDTTHRVGTDYVIIDGINVPAAAAPDAANFVIGGFDTTGYLTKHVTIRNCAMGLVAGSPLVDHSIGIIHGADGVTIENCTFVGPNTANCIDIYSQPAPLNVVVQRCIFDGWAIALQTWDGATTPVITIQVLHNTFKGNGSAVDLRHHSTALVRDNAFSGPNTGAVSIYDPYNAASTTADHNFFSQTFDTNYFLAAGQTGRGAASDGTDAGAKQAPPATTVTVTTIADLYTALANNAPDITLAPGTYSGRINIDSRFAARTVPGVIHTDGVVNTGNGQLNGVGLSIHGGAHDLDFQGGITFANATMTQAGVIDFGGWDEPGVHHITIRKPKVLSSVLRASIDHSTEHAAYFSHSRGGCHDILIEDLDVDASAAMGLASAVHMDHADNGLVNAYNVTIRRLKYVGNRGRGEPTVQQAIILWVPPVHDWLFDGATITNANGLAIRFESVGASNIVFKDIVSTNSGGFYSAMGANPPGVTFVNCSLA
jgi:hypothetical protein